jgi:non-ribosomal peptide synthetase component E (peptide arylation enzyme)
MLRSGLRWRPADFAAQVRKRANALAASDVKPGSTVIVARSGSAPFFADLFAVWTLGGTAACIDPALTKNEIETLVEFVQPSALLVGDVAIAAGINVPALELDQVAGSTTAPAPISPSNPNDPLRSFFSLRAQRDVRKVWSPRSTPYRRVSRSIGQRSAAPAE